MTGAARPAPWIHAFIDLPEPLLGAGLDFWAAVTGWPAAQAWPDRPEFASLAPPDGDAYLHGQRIDRGTPRVHLDVVVPAGVEIDDERARHDELGAVPGDRYPWWQAMTSPGGLAYCLVTAGQHTRPGPVTWPEGHRSRVAQACVDLPDTAFDRERDFWRAATGWPEEAARSPEFTRLAPPATSPMGLLLQRLGTGEEGPARMHLDLGADDPDGEVRRLRAAGAEPVDETHPWAVLRGPAGLPFCVASLRPG